MNKTLEAVRTFPQMRRFVKDGGVPYLMLVCACRNMLLGIEGRDPDSQAIRLAAWLFADKLNLRYTLDFALDTLEPMLDADFSEARSWAAWAGVGNIRMPDVPDMMRKWRMRLEGERLGMFACDLMDALLDHREARGMSTSEWVAVSQVYKNIGEAMYGRAQAKKAGRGKKA